MHRCKLKPYKGPGSRQRCPACNKPNTFVPYIDTQTGDIIHPDVGRCNRLIKCAYHFTPKQYFTGQRYCGEAPPRSNPGATKSSLKRNHRSITNRDCFAKPPLNHAAFSDGPTDKNIPTFFSAAVLNQSIIGLPHNHFFTYLQQLFGFETAIILARRYYIGNSSHWPGATVFWQVDEQEHIHSGKIMLYSPDTGKRVKQPFNHITWMHSALKLPQFSLKQCLFGQHLVKDFSKTIAIVESEKTAIIASGYLPQYTWLACGSLSNLTEERLLPLKGRNIVLYPDLNAFDTWSLKAKQLLHIADFMVSDVLERKATGDARKQGLDLADYLVRLKAPV